MNLNPQLIDEIVARVVEQLRTPAAPPRPAPAAASNSPAATSPLVVNKSVVRLSQHIITAEILETQARGVPQIHIAPRAILTPSARDYLRQMRMECVRDSAATAHSSGPGWLLLISSPSASAAAALTPLQTAGGRWEQRVSGTAEEAARQATAALCRGEVTGVAVLSKAPEVVACLANRQERVRAAVVGCVPTVEAACRKIGANLIAIHPGKKGSFELRHMLQAFATAAPVAPPGWPT